MCGLRFESSDGHFEFLLSDPRSSKLLLSGKGSMRQWRDALGAPSAPDEAAKKLAAPADLAFLAYEARRLDEVMSWVSG